MKNLLIILFLLINVTLKSQKLNGHNKYVIVPQSVDSSDIHFLKPGQKLITNADVVLGISATEADTTEIFKLIDQYKVKLKKLPDTGILHKNEIFVYDGEYVRIVKTHKRTKKTHKFPKQEPDYYSFKPMSKKAKNITVNNL
jgi:hypothetical protein